MGPVPPAHPKPLKQGLSLYRFIHPSIHLSVCRSVCLSISLSLYLSVCLSLSLSICLPIYLSIYLYVYLYTYMHTYIHKNIRLGCRVSLTGLELRSNSRPVGRKNNEAPAKMGLAPAPATISATQSSGLRV